MEEFLNRYAYDIELDRIGSGAFGTVYKAYDNYLNVFKAIKIAEVKFIDGREFSLKSEFKASQSVPTHRNIAHYEEVLQFRMPSGLFDYAIMQYYEEGSLKILLQNKSLTRDQKIQIVKGILNGLKVLHENKIIHRDLKPSNILIAKDNRGNYVPKISDFGLSKLVNQSEDHSFSGSFAGGTLDYSSPEQLYGHKLRFNSDLWSLGVITYEIFTGKKPFELSDFSGSPDLKRRQVLSKIISGDMPGHINECPEPYQSFIRFCLQRDPLKRVQSADDLINYLKKPFPVKFEEDESVEDFETLVLSPEENKKKTDLFNFWKSRQSEQKEAESEKKLTEEEIELRKIEEKKVKDQKKKDESLKKLLKEGDELIKNGNPAYALELLIPAAEKFDKKDKLLALIEIAKKEQEAISRRVENEKKQKAAAELNEKFADLINEAEKAYLKNQLSEALILYKEALKIRSDDNLLSKVKEIESKLLREKEKEQAKQADAQKEKEIQARYLHFLDKGNQYLKEGQFEFAVKMFNKCLELKPNNGEASEKKQVAEHKIEKLKRKALREEANELEIQGDKYFHSENYREALKAYQKALQILPDNEELTAKVELCKEKLKRKRKPFLIWLCKSITTSIISKRIIVPLLALVFLSVALYFWYSADSEYRVVQRDGLSYLQIGGNIHSDGFELIFFQSSDSIFGKTGRELFLFNWESNQFELQSKWVYFEGRAVEISEDFISSIGDVNKLRVLRESTSNAELIEMIDSAIISIADRRFRQIMQSPRIDDLEEFIKVFPESPQVDEAKIQIDILITELVGRSTEESLFEQLKLNPSRRLAEEYLSIYPNGVYEKEVREIIRQLDLLDEEDSYDDLRLNFSFKAAEDYLESYPDGRFREEVIELRESRINQLNQEWQGIKNRRNEAEVRGFLNKDLPEMLSSEAQSLLNDLEKERLDWEKIQGRGNESQLRQYLNKYPNSPYRDLAEKELQKLTDVIQSEKEIEEEEKQELNSLIIQLEADFVQIPAGIHTLGCEQPGRGCNPDDGRKTVNISEFYMSRFEMTQGFFKAIMGYNPSTYTDCNNCPVENLSYNEVQKFIRKLNRLEGNPYIYRLPTEAEWEYAASGGRNYPFSGGSNVDRLAVVDDRTGGSKPVGSKSPNHFGLYDMSGNVAEYCDDWYVPFSGSGGSLSYKVVRGGSFYQRENSAMIKNREPIDPDTALPFVGFRLVRNLR